MDKYDKEFIMPSRFAFSPIVLREGVMNTVTQDIECMFQEAQPLYRKRTIFKLWFFGAVACGFVLIGLVVAPEPVPPWIVLVLLLITLSFGMAGSFLRYANSDFYTCMEEPLVACTKAYGAVAVHEALVALSRQGSYRQQCRLLIWLLRPRFTPPPLTDVQELLFMEKNEDAPTEV